VTTFDQNWHHLYCTQDLPEEKLGAKFPFTTLAMDTPLLEVPVLMLSLAFLNWKQSQ